MTRNGLALVIAALLVGPGAANAARGERMERRGERMERQGERRERRGEREEKRGERMEKQGQREEATGERMEKQGERRERRGEREERPPAQARTRPCRPARRRHSNSSVRLRCTRGRPRRIAGGLLFRAAGEIHPPLIRSGVP